MANLTVVARIEAENDKIDMVKIELLKLLEKTRAEKGCLQYDLHQDNENPAIFIFYEIWESKEALQVHMKSEHIKSYSIATEGALKSFIVNKMNLINI